MNHDQLAGAYARILTLYKFFARGQSSAERNLDELRTSVSRWVAPFRLTGTRMDYEVTNHPCWCVFRPRTHQTDAHIFFLHGGGLVFYRVEDYAPVLAHIAATTSATVTAFHYPRAPEHGFDEIVENIAGAMDRRLAEIPHGSLTLAGDSIGAYLALHLVMSRYPRRFDRLVLINPVLDLLRQRSSYSIYGEGFLLSACNMSWFQELCRRDRRSEDFDLFDLAPRMLRLLPTVYLFSAEFDVLRDEALDWAEYLRGRGVFLTHHHFARLAHDFVLYAGAVPEAREALEVICTYLKHCAASTCL